MESQDNGTVVKLTTIPPGMNVTDVRNYFSSYGIEKLFLHSDSKRTSKKKVRNYQYGYIEFKDAESAENVALLFNGRLIGGGKGSRFHDRTWNIKYMPELKWNDLLEKVNTQKKLYEQRINSEMEQINKVHNFIVGKKIEAEGRRKKIKKNIEKPSDN